jgi:hypothetical protein
MAAWSVGQPNHIAKRRRATRKRPGGRDDRAHQHNVQIRSCERCGTLIDAWVSCIVRKSGRTRRRGHPPAPDDKQHIHELADSLALRARSKCRRGPPACQAGDPWLVSLANKQDLSYRSLGQRGAPLAYISTELPIGNHRFAGLYRWSQRDSNPRPPACKAGALPAELWPRGFEFRATMLERIQCPPALATR